DLGQHGPVRAQHGSLLLADPPGDGSLDVTVLRGPRVLADRVADVHAAAQLLRQRRDGLLAAQRRRGDDAPDTERLDRACGGLRLLLTAWRERTLAVDGGGSGAAVPQQHDRERVEAADGDELLEPREHVAVDGVADLLPGLLERQPLERGDLLVGREVGCRDRLGRRLHRPVVHDLLAPRRHVILDAPERGSERPADPRLLRDLPHRGLGERLARIDLALRERQVAELLPVDEQHLDAVIDTAPDDAAGGEDAPAHPQRLVCRERRRRWMRDIVLSWTSARGWPSASRWWRVHVPLSPRCQVADPSSMARS